MGTIGTFAIELYLKLLSVIKTFDKSTLQGNHPFGHDLGELYKSIKDEYGKELEDKYLRSKYIDKNKSLENYLIEVGKAFESWRYSYTKSKLEMNLNIISDLLLIFDEYTDVKFNDISKALAKKGINNFPDNSMQMLNIDDINDII